MQLNEGNHARASPHKGIDYQFLDAMKGADPGGHIGGEHLGIVDVKTESVMSG